MKTAFRPSVLLLLLVTLSISKASAEEFSTGDVIAGAVSSPQCLDWRVSGVCFWLVCVPGSCWIESTARFAHNLPDLVVSSYNKLGENPWTEGKAIGGGMSRTGVASTVSSPGFPVIPTGGTYSNNTSQGRGNARFKEVDVIGSPVAEIVNAVPEPGFLCESEAVSYLPYFLSGLDGFAWRTGLPEMFLPETYTAAYTTLTLPPTFHGRHLGGTLNTWGRIYPRTGWATQTDDAKVAALAAQRAIDITLQQNQPHIYIPFGYNGFSMRTRVMGDRSASNSADCKASGGSWTVGMGSDGGGSEYCRTRTQTFPQWMPPANEDRIAWQLISPEVRSCEAFGSDDALWSSDRTDPQGEYGYLYWRCYECCYPNAGAYIGNVQWDGCND